MCICISFKQTLRLVQLGTQISVLWFNWGLNNWVNWLNAGLKFESFGSTEESNLSPWFKWWLKFEFFVSTWDSKFSSLVQLRTQMCILWFNYGLKFESLVQQGLNFASFGGSWYSNLSPLFTYTANYNEFLSQHGEVLAVIVSP